MGVGASSTVTNLTIEKLQTNYCAIEANHDVNGCLLSGSLDSFKN